MISISIASEVMTRATEELRATIGALRAEYAVFPDPVRNAVKTAEAALDTLENDLRDAVLGDGGVHGSAERAWEVWQDLAVDTGNLLQRAQGFAEDYSLTGYIKKAGEVAIDTARNVVVGAEVLTAVIVVVLIAFALGGRR